MTIIGLTVFAVGCSLGSILIWLVVKSGTRSRLILNSIPTVIYVLAIEAEGFRSQWVSDSVRRILGYEVEEVLAPDCLCRRLLSIGLPCLKSESGMCMPV